MDCAAFNLAACDSSHFWVPGTLFVAVGAFVDRLLNPIVRRFHHTSQYRVIAQKKSPSVSVYVATWKQLLFNDMLIMARVWMEPSQTTDPLWVRFERRCLHPAIDGGPAVLMRARLMLYTAFGSALASIPVLSLLSPSARNLSSTTHCSPPDT